MRLWTEDNEIAVNKEELTDLATKEIEFWLWRYVDMDVTEYRVSIRSMYNSGNAETYRNMRY